MHMKSHIFKLMKYQLTAILAILSFFSCSKSDDPTPTPSKQGRTVMVYVSAENNLSSYAQININDMISGAASLNNDDRLLVYVDRASRKEKPFIIRINGNKKNPVDTVRTYESDFYSSDPERMKEVLTWCMTNYPNKDYGLVLWGHANGWIIEPSVSTKAKGPSRAFGQDTGEDTDDNKSLWMNISQMRQALSALPHSLKFIFADCCAFQCVEVGYELRNTTEYIIASPAEIPGEGAPYKQIIPALFQKTDATMFQQTCDIYNAAINNGCQVPISTVKTSELQALADMTRNIIVNELSNKTFTTDNLVYYYNNVSLYNKDERIMYDMKDFMRNNISSESYQQWLNALDAAVIYKKGSTKWLTSSLVDFSDFAITDINYGGISMFVPLKRYEQTKHHYNELIKQTAWYQAVGWSAIGW